MEGNLEKIEGVSGTKYLVLCRHATGYLVARVSPPLRRNISRSPKFFFQLLLPPEISLFHPPNFKEEQHQ